MVSERFNIAALRAIPLFAPLNDEELELLRPGIKVLSMAPGDLIIREGDSADRLFCLVEGEVQVVKNYLTEGAQTIDLLGPGRYFGDMALLGGDGKRSATVVASEKSTFLTIDRESFKKIVLGNARIAYTMLVESYRRLRQANEIISASREVC
jgi:CRP-like cAMP-binding protein